MRKCFGTINDRLRDNLDPDQIQKFIFTFFNTAKCGGIKLCKKSCVAVVIGQYWKVEIPTCMVYLSVVECVLYKNLYSAMCGLISDTGSDWYAQQSLTCWPAAAGGSLGVTQKVTILGLSQTGHPQGTTDYYRRPCILCCSFSHVKQFVVVDTECTLRCMYLGSCWNANFSDLLRLPLVLTDVVCCLITNPATISWTY